jgi:hypothetical protein
MNVTVAYDLSPAMVESAIKNKLIELGWTPPAAHPAPVLPTVNVRCETTNGSLQGVTYLNVIRVELEDDGSLTAVTNHWPTCNQPAAQRQWVEVEQIKWDGDKLIAKLKENT